MLECTECGELFELEVEECTECGHCSVDERLPFVAVSAITAEFVTKTGSSRLDHEVGSLWPTDDDVCNRLIAEVESKFKRKNKYHSYYEQESDTRSTPSRLTAYISGGLTFTQLVQGLMLGLVEAAINTGAHKVAGGNIVFMHYRSHDDGDIGRLLAIMVDKKDGFDFDEHLVPKNSQHINLEAMRQAALFDLTLFSAVYPQVPERETYLKFIKGASKGKFFREAFGCTIRAENSQSVSELYDAIADFQEEHNLPRRFYDQARDKVKDLLTQAAKNKTAVFAETLYEAIESALTVDSPLRGKFSQFVNSNGYEINNHIEPTSQAVEAEEWVEVSGSDESFSAKVYHNKIKTIGSGSQVEYDPIGKKLMLSIVEPEMQRTLEKLAETSDND